MITNLWLYLVSLEQQLQHTWSSPSLLWFCVCSCFRLLFCSVTEIYLSETAEALVLLLIGLWFTWCCFFSSRRIPNLRKRVICTQFKEGCRCLSSWYLWHALFAAHCLFVLNVFLFWWLITYQDGLRQGHWFKGHCGRIYRTKTIIRKLNRCKSIEVAFCVCVCAVLWSPSLLILGGCFCTLCGWVCLGPLKVQINMPTL